MKPDLSFFAGGIRPQNWVQLYNSIGNAMGKYSFELVLCGPYLPPAELFGAPNFKFISDFGSCARAAQIAALNCEASVITLTADDGVYEPGSMAKALEQYRSISNSYFPVLGLRYEEGGNRMYEKDWYWRMKNHDKMVDLPGIPDDTPMSLNSIIGKDIFLQIGGYDCKLFETCNWGGHDLMIRLWKYGINFQQFKEKNLSVHWEPGEKPEHRPIYLADHPPEPTSNYHTFRTIYSQSSPSRIVRSDSWTEAETVWSKRFK